MKYISKVIKLAFVSFAVSVLCPAQLRAQQDETAPAGQPEARQEVAYGSQPAWMVTGAVSSTWGDQMQKNFTTNVTNTLYGRIPGLTTMQGGFEPGKDGASFYIRGIATYGSASRTPFVVIDGMPSTMTFLQQLSVNEIESVSVLKDAAATAIYGNRGANGVLVVNTRRGTDSPLKVDFKVQYGFQTPVRLPDYLDSYQYATLYNEALANEGKQAAYNAAALEAYRTGSDPLLFPSVNWQDELLRKATPIANYNVSARGGGENVKYFVLFDVVNNPGILKKTEKVSDNTKDPQFTRYNFRTNVDLQLSRRLSASITVGGTVEDKTVPGTSEDTWNILDMISTVPPNAFPVFAARDMFGGNSMYENPLTYWTQTGYNSYNGRAAQASVRVTEQLDMITPGLSISGAVSFNSYFKSFSTKYRGVARYSISRDDSGEVVYDQFGLDSSLEGDEGNSYQWRNMAVQGFLNYDRNFGRHDVSGLVVANYDDYTVTGGTLPYKNIGLGGRFTYAYDRRYIAEFSFGYNGDDNYLKGHRFGFFPAGAVGWIVSNEGFMADAAAVDFLKIRASYGLTGNGEIGGTRYMYNQYYDWNGYYMMGTTNNSWMDTYTEGQLANPDVTWEREKQFDIGVEAQLWKGVTLKADYFIRKRNHILTYAYGYLPNFLGAQYPQLNIGKVDNKGYEIAAGYSTVSRTGVAWFAEAGIWSTRNKVIYSAEEPQLYDYMLSAGRRVDQPFMLQAIGFYRDQADIDNSPTPIFGEVRPGDIKYKDQNGDGVIDQHDNYPIGHSQFPQITYSLRGGFEFRGLDVELMFQGAAKRSVYLEGKNYWAFQDNGKVTSYALNRWTEQTASTADYPRLSTNGDQNNYQYSSFWQKNGNFLKLRSVEIGYTLPVRVAGKLRLDRLRVFVNATNLFSIDAMGGYADPETIYGYPSMRTFSMGISVHL